MTEIHITTDERGLTTARVTGRGPEMVEAMLYGTVRILRSALRPGGELEDAVADYGQLLLAIAREEENDHGHDNH